MRLEFFAVSDASARPSTRTLLRGSLGAYVQSLGRSAESTVVLEYAPAVQAPVPGPEAPMPDSILALSGLDSCVVAGLGDGYVQVFTAASLESVARSHAVAPLLTFAAHAGAINTVHAAAVGEGVLGCATGGDDGVVRLWRARAAPGAAAELSAVLGGAPNGEGAQPDSIASLMISADADLIAAGDARGGVFLWSAAALQGRQGAAAPPAGAAAPAAEQVPPSSSALAGSKRPRPAAAAAPAAAAVAAAQAPVSALRPSEAFSRTTGIAWLAGGTSLAAASLSGRIATLDVEAGLSPGTAFSASKPCLGLSASPLGSVFASAHTDRCVRVWDARGAGDGGSGGARASLRLDDDAGGSPAWVSAVAWHPVSSHLVASGGHAGAVTLWDTRAPGAPLFRVVHAHARAGGAAARTLAVAWSGAEGTVLASGGDDARLRASSLPSLAGGA